MSGPAALIEPADDLVLDAGVLQAIPTAEFGGFHAVMRHGGIAVLRWRGWFLQAQAQAVPATPQLDVAARYAQVVVRISRGQAATAYDLACALAALSLGGTLVVVGANGLGASTWTKRVAARCGAPSQLITRAKSRLAVFSPPPAATWPLPAPTPPTPSREGLADAAGGPALQGEPGIFLQGALDRGTALLVDYLRDPEQHLATPEEVQASPGAILDLGCGAGHLAFAALARFPHARAVLCDADHHALRAAAANAGALGLTPRLAMHWLDASEALPERGFDLVLINPPAHAGLEVDLAAAQAMIRAGATALAPGGRLVVVANQRLPYERELGRIGPWRLAQQTDGYKILEVREAPAHG